MSWMVIIGFLVFVLVLSLIGWRVYKLFQKLYEYENVSYTAKVTSKAYDPKTLGPFTFGGTPAYNRSGYNVTITTDEDNLSDTIDDEGLFRWAKPGYSLTVVMTIVRKHGSRKIKTWYVSDYQYS